MNKLYVVLNETNVKLLSALVSLKIEQTGEWHEIFSLKMFFLIVALLESLHYMESIYNFDVQITSTLKRTTSKRLKKLLPHVQFSKQ